MGPGSRTKSPCQQQPPILGGVLTDDSNEPGLAKCSGGMLARRYEGRIRRRVKGCRLAAGRPARSRRPDAPAPKALLVHAPGFGPGKPLLRLDPTQRGTPAMYAR